VLYVDQRRASRSVASSDEPIAARVHIDASRGGDPVLVSIDDANPVIHASARVATTATVVCVSELASTVDCPPGAALLVVCSDLRGWRPQRQPPSGETHGAYSKRA
jgi:hypothetical protein